LPQLADDNGAAVFARYLWSLAAAFEHIGIHLQDLRELQQHGLAVQRQDAAFDLGHPTGRPAHETGESLLIDAACDAGLCDPLADGEFARQLHLVISLVSPLNTRYDPATSANWQKNCQ
jgi:hypothetical protein